MLCLTGVVVFQIKSNQKRIYIAPYIRRIQRRLADGLSEVGATIQISFKVFFESECSVSVNNIDRQTVPQRKCSGVVSDWLCCV